MIIGIVAVDRQGAIGKDGKLPWHYSADMKHFKATTIGNACVMGYHTWLTLKRPLKDRLNIVLSRRFGTEELDEAETGRQEQEAAAGGSSSGSGRGDDTSTSVITLKHVPTVVTLSSYLRCNLFVIGGAQIYRAFLPYIEQWIVTEVPLTVEGADVFVPENYLEGFRKVDSKPLEEGLRVSFYEKT